MLNLVSHQTAIVQHGFTIIDDVLSSPACEAIVRNIQLARNESALFRQSADLFAVRQVFKTVASLQEQVLTPEVKEILEALFGSGYFVVKSIYFDKPGASNWFVSYHQDLTIAVHEKADVPGFGPWTVKQDQYAVQPPLPILEDNFTLRLHLDDTGEANGALRVIPGSHLKGIYRPETIDWHKEQEVFCPVSKGGVMIMRPLLLHASSRTTNGMPRRVVHVEFSRNALPAPLQWAEAAG